MNNLIYLFVFSFIGISIVSMGMTNRNVQIVQIVRVESGIGFAGETCELFVHIKNETKHSVAKKISVKLLKDSSVAFAEEIKPGQLLSLCLSWTPSSRGRQSYPKVMIESDFPYGILRSWKVFQMPGEILIFPGRKGQALHQEHKAGLWQGIEDFRELREFRMGDSVGRIHWRASSKSQQLLVKQYEAEGLRDLDLDWERTQGDTETRLSQLALWVDQAEKQRLRYRLVTPWWSSSRGPHHKIWFDSLKSLAMQRDPAS